MPWDDVRLLSPERKVEVDKLATMAMEEQRQQELAEAAARAEREAKALQQAVSVAEEQVRLAQADQELAVGTAIAFHISTAGSASRRPLHGKYMRFKKNRTTANEHYIEFEGFGNTSIKVLRLKKIVEKWRVAPMSSYFNTSENAGDGRVTLATLVAQLKTGEDLAL